MFRCSLHPLEDPQARSNAILETHFFLTDSEKNSKSQHKDLNYGKL